jgi:uncharacterized membrane protein
VLATNWFFVIFRLIHILAGVAWVGGVFFLVMYVQPSAAAIGPAAGPMMGQLLGVRKVVDRLLMLAGTTIAAGLVLYIKRWIDKGSFGDWVGSGYGAALTIGMIAAIAAASIGAFGTRPNVQRLMALQGQIAASGGPPAPEQGAEVAALQAKLKAFARVALGLLVIAVAMMATAEYW